MIVELATNTSDPNAAARRLGGWSESWYDDDTNQTTLRNNFNRLSQRRAALLPRGSAVVGQRYQQLEPTGPSQSTAQRYPGNATWGTDQPQSALYCKVPGIGVRNVRPMTLRGIPDVMCSEGEFSPTDAFQAALNAYFAELRGYKFHGKDLTLNRYPIFSVGADGTIVLEETMGYAVGDIVTISRVRDAFGRSRTARVRIKTRTDGKNIVVDPWIYGVCTKGKLVGELMAYPTVSHTEISVGRMTTRRVGRPFTQYRGRQSKKR